MRMLCFSRVETALVLSRNRHQRIHEPNPMELLLCLVWALRATLGDRAAGDGRASSPPTRERYRQANMCKLMGD